MREVEPVTVAVPWRTLFEVPDPARFEEVLEALTPRQRGLVVAAANFAALDSPGAELAMHVYRSDEDDVITTDVRSYEPPATPRPEVGVFPIVSRMEGAARPHVKNVDDGWSVVPESHRRTVLVSPDRIPAEARSRPSLRPRALAWAARERLDRSFPMLYDGLRQLALARRARATFTRRIPRHRPPARLAAVRPSDAAGKPRAVLFGLHWLEMGGAERWALETVALAREQGFVPVVVCDRHSQNPWITRPELEGAVVLPLSYPMYDDVDDQPLLRAILENFDVAAVYVHHCQWMYDRLPWIRAASPGTRVVDSLHIIEYGGGGYPGASVHMSDYIDLHHVISPQLFEWMTGVQGVPSERVHLAPLHGLTTGEFADVEFSPRSSPDALTLAFVGRLTHQKRPYLFLRLVAALTRAGLPVRAILHGDGTMAEPIARRIERAGLAAVVVRRGEDWPVSDTLREADVLVMSSQNEGIALTTIEAIAAGVPVLSTAVGSQDSLVAEEFLVPRNPAAFVAASLSILRRVVEDDGLRRSVWEDERERLRRFSEMESATEWLHGEMRRWHAS